MTPSFLAHRTSLTAIALPINWRVIISCISVAFVFFVVVVVVVVFTTLYAGLCAIMYVIFAARFVGFEVLLYNHGGFPPSQLSGRFPTF
jgi:hypothetical protein